ncbi:MAG: hypothetical protein WAV30_02680 [Microgenomates group bacterium]
MNYTPLDIAALKGTSNEKKDQSKAFDFNAIFLGLIVVTLLVMAILLFILIQKKIQTLSYVPFFA